MKELYVITFYPRGDRWRLYEDDTYEEVILDSSVKEDVFKLREELKND